MVPDEAAPPAPAAGPALVLHLFVAGATLHSVRATQNIKQLCEAYLPGRYELLITDIYQQPESARQEQLVAAPTLIRRWPLPVRRLVGDLSDRLRVVAALGLPDLPPPPTAAAPDA